MSLFVDREDKRAKPFSGLIIVSLQRRPRKLLPYRGGEGSSPLHTDLPDHQNPMHSREDHRVVASSVVFVILRMYLDRMTQKALLVCQRA